MRKLALITLALGLVVWFTQQPRAAEEAKPTVAKFAFRAMTRGEIEKLAATDDKGMEGMRTEALTNGLNKMGSEGWDLVGIEPPHSRSEHVNGESGKAFGVEIVGTGVRGVATVNYPGAYIFKRSN